MNQKKNGKGKIVIRILTLVFALFIAFFNGCFRTGIKYGEFRADKTDTEVSPAPGEASVSFVPAEASASPVFETPPSKEDDGVLTVYAVDVGQGDAFLLVSPNGKTMMIDAGEAKTQKTVQKFIESKGISTLDVVVATHPHSDHIGAFPYLFDNFDVGKLLMPDVAASTETYKNLMQSVQANNINYYAVWCGDTVEWDEDCTVTILAPVEGIEYSVRDMNEWSIIMRVEYKDTSMIFTGDAEVHAEQAALLFNDKALLDADVLKVCHHGSAYSSTQGFLDAVSPKYAIISVGKDNSYGHPDFDTLFKLENMNVSIYRTDLNGNITIILDGENVEIITEKN